MSKWEIFIESKNEAMVEFFTKRKVGAEKIAAEARNKGGPAMLTAWHFAAKKRPYEEVIDAIKANKPKSYYDSKCRAGLHKIMCGRMGQKQFQEAMGIAEVYGEALAELFGS
jgi:hypothetical protein